MEKKGLVSVLMPVYNGFPDIKLSLASLQWQTYKNWECIIVNDGSTDGTKEYLNQLSDSRIKVIHLTQNSGRGNARQVALDHTNGEFIAYLDVGDWYSPEKLKLQIQYLQNNMDVALVSVGIYSYGMKKKIRRVRCLGNGISSLFNKNNGIACAASMIRKEVTINHKYNSCIDYGEDIDYFSRCMYGKRYTVLNEIHYYYSEFDSMSIVKLRKSYKEIYYREKEIRTYLKYLYYSYLAPVLGIDFIIKRRGQIPTDIQNRTFDDLLKQLKWKLEDRKYECSEG